MRYHILPVKWVSINSLKLVEFIVIAFVYSQLVNLISFQNIKMNFSIYWAVVAVINILLITSKVDRAGGKSVAKLESIDLSHYGSSLFGEPSKDVGLEVENWKDNQKSGNPEELGSYLEGDILFPRGMSRNGLIAETYRWPDGQIPFEIVGDYGIIRQFFFF